MDSSSLERRRRELLPRTTVLVVDRQTSQALQHQLDDSLSKLEQQAGSAQQETDHKPSHFVGEIAGFRGLSHSQERPWCPM
jgi:hypothetical protein